MSLPQMDGEEKQMNTLMKNKGNKGAMQNRYDLKVVAHTFSACTGVVVGGAFPLETACFNYQTLVYEKNLHPL